jgi:membrane associated rhomboid family serine protease
MQNIPAFIAQLALFQFIHGGTLHLFLNGLFLYQAGPELEERMSKKEFRLFFLLSTLFVAVSILLFSSGVTIGMSGFCMALLAYLWYDLFSARHPHANQILIMLVINVLL